MASRWQSDVDAARRLGVIRHPEQRHAEQAGGLAGGSGDSSGRRRRDARSDQHRRGATLGDVDDVAGAGSHDVIAPGETSEGVLFARRQRERRDERGRATLLDDAGHGAAGDGDGGAGVGEDEHGAIRSIRHACPHLVTRSGASRPCLDSRRRRPPGRPGLDSAVSAG